MICLPFQLRYTFPKYMLLQEPLLVVSALFLLFLLVIIYVRLDFSIAKVLRKHRILDCLKCVLNHVLIIILCCVSKYLHTFSGHLHLVFAVIAYLCSCHIVTYKVKSDIK